VNSPFQNPSPHSPAPAPPACPRLPRPLRELIASATPAHAAARSRSPRAAHRQAPEEVPVSLAPSAGRLAPSLSAIDFPLFGPPERWISNPLRLIALQDADHLRRAAAQPTRHDTEIAHLEQSDLSPQTGRFYAVHAHLDDADEHRLQAVARRIVAEWSATRQAPSAPHASRPETVQLTSNEAKSKQPDSELTTDPASSPPLEAAVQTLTAATQLFTAAIDSHRIATEQHRIATEQNCLAIEEHCAAAEEHCAAAEEHCAAMQSHAAPQSPRARKKPNRKAPRQTPAAPRTANRKSDRAKSEPTKTSPVLPKALSEVEGSAVEGPPLIPTSHHPLIDSSNARPVPSSAAWPAATRPLAAACPKRPPPRRLAFPDLLKPALDKWRADHLADLFEHDIAAPLSAAAARFNTPETGSTVNGGVRGSVVSQSAQSPGGGAQFRRRAPSAPLLPSVSPSLRRVQIAAIALLVASLLAGTAWLFRLVTTNVEWPRAAVPATGSSQAPPVELAPGTLPSVPSVSLYPLARRRFSSPVFFSVSLWLAGKPPFISVHPRSSAVFLIRIHQCSSMIKMLSRVRFALSPLSRFRGWFALYY